MFGKRQDIFKSQTYLKVSSRMNSLSEAIDKSRFNNPEIMDLGKSYVNKLLGESDPIRMWGSDPENYYYQIGMHCYCAGLIIGTTYDKNKFNKENALRYLTSDDSVRIAKDVLRLDGVDFKTSLYYESCYLPNIKVGKKVDNSDENVVAGMLAFFMIGATEDCSKNDDDASEADDEPEDENEKAGEDENSTPSVPVKKIDIVTRLIECGAKAGYTKGGSFPNIPEIMVQSRTVVEQVIDGITEYYKQNPNPNLNPFSDMLTRLVFCCYAGMGAVAHWNVNWDSLKRNGIYNTLTAERGLFEMDEYVTDFIGIGFGSEESKKLFEHLRYSAIQAMVPVSNIDSTNNRAVMNAYLESCEAMYLYGMIIDMNRLGMG